MRRLPPVVQILAQDNRKLTGFSISVMQRIAADAPPPFLNEAGRVQEMQGTALETYLNFIDAFRKLRPRCRRDHSVE